MLRTDAPVSERLWGVTRRLAFTTSYLGKQIGTRSGCSQGRREGLDGSTASEASREISAPSIMRLSPSTLISDWPANFRRDKTRTRTAPSEGEDVGMRTRDRPSYLTAINTSTGPRPSTCTRTCSQRTSVTTTNSNDQDSDSDGDSDDDGADEVYQLKEWHEMWTNGLKDCKRTWWDQHRLLMSTVQLLLEQSTEMCKTRDAAAYDFGEDCASMYARLCAAASKMSTQDQTSGTSTVGSSDQTRFTDTHTLDDVRMSIENAAGSASDLCASAGNTQRDDSCLPTLTEVKDRVDRMVGALTDVSEHYLPVLSEGVAYIDKLKANAEALERVRREGERVGDSPIVQRSRPLLESKL